MHHVVTEEPSSPALVRLFCNHQKYRLQQRHIPPHFALRIVDIICKMSAGFLLHDTLARALHVPQVWFRVEVASPPFARRYDVPVVVFFPPDKSNSTDQKAIFVSPIFSRVMPLLYHSTNAQSQFPRTLVMSCPFHHLCSIDFIHPGAFPVRVPLVET